MDKVVDRLPLWKSRLLAKAGRTTLTKVTLTVIPIHISIAMTLSTWTVRPRKKKKKKKICKAFLWTGTEYLVIDVW